MKFLREQDMVKSSDEFKNGCIPMQCGAQMDTKVWRSSWKCPAMWTAHGSKMTSCRCSRWLADLCSFEF